MFSINLPVIKYLHDHLRINLGVSKRYYLIPVSMRHGIYCTMICIFICYEEKVKNIYLH